MTPEQLLTRTTQFVTAELSWLWGCYYAHVPEVRRRASAPGVFVRVYKHHDFDARKVWRLASVHVDDKPVMIVRNAGREGDDHADRYVFDLYHYRDMIDRLGRLPSDRLDGPRTRLGWQWSFRHAYMFGREDHEIECERADQFFGDRNLDSTADWWEPY